jgi:hypothetical protein
VGEIKPCAGLARRKLSLTELSRGCGPTSSSSFCCREGARGEAEPLPETPRQKDIRLPPTKCAISYNTSPNHTQQSNLHAAVSRGALVLQQVTHFLRYSTMALSPQQHGCPQVWAGACLNPVLFEARE